MLRRSVDVSKKLEIVGFILLKYVVDGSKQHSCNGNNSFFVPPAFFYVVVAITNFRIAFFTNRTQSTLNQKRFNISTCFADSGRFLLSGTFVVLRCKTCPGAKMLGGWKHGEIVNNS